MRESTTPPTQRVSQPLHRLMDFSYSKCVVNPRRACAARVTVVVLAGACLSVSLLPRFLSLHSSKRPSSDTNSFRVTLA